MPKYVYYCKKCEGEFEVHHSLKKVVQICQLCGLSDEVVRRPSTIFLSKKGIDSGNKNKVGSVVKETIESAREELGIEQERLAKREHQNE